MSSSLEPWNGGEGSGALERRRRSLVMTSGSVKEEVDLPWILDLKEEVNQSPDLDWWNAQPGGDWMDLSQPASGSKEEIKEEIKEEVMEEQQQLFTNLESKPMSF